MTTLRRLMGVLALLLCVAAPAQARSNGAEPRVDRLDVEEVSSLDAGTALHFSLYGTPGGRALLHIAGADRPLPMNELQAGFYEGTHIVAPHERIAPDSRVTAELRVGDRLASATLEEPLVLGAAMPSRCNDCGVVQSVNAVEVRGGSGMMGAVAGGVVGAILGRQIGKGDGRTLAGILGALGGAYAGREIERAHRQRTRHEVVLRLDDGRVQTRAYDGVPPFKVGDRVRVVQDRWLRDTGVDPR